MMSAILDRSRDEWLDHLQEMTDDELLDERARLYDAAEVAERDSELHSFVTWALKLLWAVLSCRQIARADLDVDPRAFATAFVTLAMFDCKLRGSAGVDIGELFDGAVEVAERRSHERNTDERD